MKRWRHRASRCLPHKAHVHVLSNTNKKGIWLQNAPSTMLLGPFRQIVSRMSAGLAIESAESFFPAPITASPAPCRFLRPPREQTTSCCRPKGVLCGWMLRCWLRSYVRRTCCRQRLFMSPSERPQQQQPPPSGQCQRMIESWTEEE